MNTTVLVWNIADGMNLPGVAAQLKQAPADLVLLNEVRWRWDTSQGNETKYLASSAGYPHYQYRATTQTGVFGNSKGVSVLSRYPLTNTRLHRLGPQTPILGAWGGYGIIQTTVVMGGLQHEVFSTRFAPMHPPSHSWHDPQAEQKNRLAHEQVLSLVQSVPAATAVILGGDFNAAWGSPIHTWARDFRDRSGLREALNDVGSPTDGRVDYLYYRGPYLATDAALHGVPQSSDHAYLLATLTRTDSLTDGATFVGQSVPGQVAPAQVVDATLSFRNTGSTNWAAGEYFLLAADPPGNLRWGTGRAALPSSVPPGQVAKFSFQVRAPSTHGRHAFVWHMARGDGANPFGEPSKRIEVAVAPHQVAGRCAELQAKLRAVSEEIASLQVELRSETGARKWRLVREIASLQGSANDIREEITSRDCP